MTRGAVAAAQASRSRCAWGMRASSSYNDMPGVDPCHSLSALEKTRHLVEETAPGGLVLKDEVVAALQRDET